MKKLWLCLLFIPEIIYASDSTLIEVWFVYGSKPRHGFRTTERRWFGGVHGGHVGVATDSTGVMNFGPCGKIKVFEQAKKRNGCFEKTDSGHFRFSLSDADSQVKMLVVSIPVSLGQKKYIDSVYAGYHQICPYDYAFFGMRCAAATYDLLAQSQVVKKYGHKKTWRKNFYPKKLRKKLLRQAKKSQWKIRYYPGSTHRKWESD